MTVKYKAGSKPSVGKLGAMEDIIKMNLNEIGHDDGKLRCSGKLL
jgi:hypothetical protein